MKTREELAKALNAIREAIDSDVIDSDIVNVKNKALRLTQLMGLASEAKASARKFLNKKEMEVFSNMDKSLPPSVQIRMVNAECFQENADYEYSDRLNASVSNSCEVLRSVISLHKQEMVTTLSNIG